MSALNRIGLLFGLDWCYKTTILTPLKWQLSTSFTINLKIRHLSIQIYKLCHYWITRSDWKLYLLSVICYWRHGGTYRRSLMFMVEDDVRMLRMMWRCRRRLRRRFRTNFYVLRQIFENLGRTNFLVGKINEK